jgi:hypothetical protein
LGKDIRYENAWQAQEQGEIKWEVKVLECIGFDVELYERLVSFAESLGVTQ